MSNPAHRYHTQFADCPIVAILRGLSPEDAETVGAILFECGIRIIEVPLNSPNPLKSIEILRKTLPADAIIGAGTVTREGEVRDVANAGGEIVVSPNTDPNIIRETVNQGLISAPGCLTPTEAFAALNAGAHALKIFPASVIGPSGINAIKATLPAETTLIAVGGVGAQNMAEFTKAGVAGFGLGSSLFFPGISQADLAARASDNVQSARAGLEG